MKCKFCGADIRARKGFRSQEALNWHMNEEHPSKIAAQPALKAKANFSVKPLKARVDFLVAKTKRGDNMGLPQEMQQVGYAPADVQVLTASGAITIKNGVVLLNGSGVVAATLAAPVSGLQSAGGDDGKLLRIVAQTAHAHTVTTPADKINGGDDTATFAAAVGNACDLLAAGGVWLATNLTGVTLSEV